MILLDQVLQQVQVIKSELMQVGDALNLKMLNQRKSQLLQQQAQDNFWLDMEIAQAVNTELSRIDRKIAYYNKLFSAIEDLEVLIEISEDGDEASMAEIENELNTLTEKIETLKLETLLKGKYDSNNAILALHAGAGGTEAQDWVQMLYRMYTRYCERMGYKCIVMDKLDGDEAGIKSITFLVQGENAYGYLKAEKGVHRLVRISPFDSNARRHTSFASLEVMPEIINNTDIKINSDDIKIDTYRSGGAGGQHVNKTDSAVRITHIASGIVVQCQNERSQIQNKEQAMNMLMSKLIEKQERENLEHELSLKGDIKKIEWGSQIRSYVFCPYTLVKDHRTGYESSNVNAVMDGDIEGFIIDYLKKSST